MNTPMLSDEPSDACCLGRHSLVDDLCSRITQCRPPQVFGVFGDWGCGKTSFLRHVQNQLDRDSDRNANENGPLPAESRASLSHVLWFEAWRYSAEDKPVVALLQEIRRTLRWSTDFQAKASDVVKKTFDFATKTAVATAETTLKALGEKVGLKINSEDARQPYSGQLPADLLREQLSETIGILLAARCRTRLVIIIDDLDRCHPEAALRLLEGIKIYLNLSNCVFVLGLNAREVQRAIEKHIPGVDDGDHRAARAAEYLEKICGFTFRLPYPDPGQFESLLRSLWKTAKLEKMAEPFLDAITSIVCRHRSLPPNARKIKAWANAVLGLAWQRHPALGKIPPDIPARQQAWDSLVSDAGMLALAASLHAFHPELFRRLQNNPFFIEKLQTWAQGTPPQSADATLAGAGPQAAAPREKDLLAEDLKRIQLTHWTISPAWLVHDFPNAEDQIARQHQNYDPSLPNILHCQRLLVAIDPTREQIKSWFCPAPGVSSHA